MDFTSFKQMNNSCFITALLEPLHRMMDRYRDWFEVNCQGDLGHLWRSYVIRVGEPAPNSASQCQASLEHIRTRLVERGISDGKSVGTITAILNLIKHDPVVPQMFGLSSSTVTPCCHQWVNRYSLTIPVDIAASCLQAYVTSYVATEHVGTMHRTCPSCSRVARLPCCLTTSPRVLFFDTEHRKLVCPELLTVVGVQFQLTTTIFNQHNHFFAILNVDGQWFKYDDLTGRGVPCDSCVTAAVTVMVIYERVD